MSETVVAAPDTEASAAVAEAEAEAVVAAAEAESDARVAEAEAACDIAETQAEAACEIAETQAKAAVAVAEAQNEGIGQWQNVIEHLQAESRENSERLARMEAAIAAQAERLISLTPPPSEMPPENPPNPSPNPSEGEGGQEDQGPAEPAPAERRRAHRWI